MTFVLNLAIWGLQDWEELLTLADARQLLGCLCSGKPRELSNVDSLPKENDDKVLMLTHFTWFEMDAKITHDLITNSMANATHVCLLHNSLDPCLIQI